jgi:hypothetical protein
MKKLSLTSIIALSVGLTACSNIHKTVDDGVFDITPLPNYQLLDIKADYSKKLDFKITDQEVQRLLYLIKDTLRKKVQHGRTGEELFSGAQVMLAAFAAAFSASTGVHVDVVTALSGLSALTPEIANIVNAGDKAKAYSQTLDLIEKADSEYIRARAQAVGNNSGLIPDGYLSPEGAALFVSTIAALKVMRDALLATIPKLEDLEKALGKFAQFSLNFSDINISTANLTLLASPVSNSLSAIDQLANTREIIVLKGGKLSICSSSEPNIIKVVSCAGDRIIRIVPLAMGSSTITAVNANDERATFSVTVQ